MKKRKIVKWSITHKYPNGKTRAGIIYNNKIKCDVIAFEYSYLDWDKDKWVDCYRELSLDEALTQIEVLARAVSYYTENSNKIFDKTN